MRSEPPLSQQAVVNLSCHALSTSLASGSNRSLAR
jgi:hypothetical protein